MKRLIMCCNALVVLIATGPAFAADRRPNVIILMTDQMRGQAMSVAGNSQVITPNLQRLADQGVYLPNTIANTPVCCPARATILTGMYPHRHGVICNDLRLNEKKTSFAEVLAEAGYATAFIGKWHLDGGVRLPGFIPPGPRRQGFQFWAANQCSHEHFNSWYFRDTDRKIPIKEFETKIWMDEAINFIRQNKDKPFFLWWACGPPHNPYKAPKRFRKMYDPAKLTMRPNWKPGQPHGKRKDIAHYYGMITEIDQQVGRLMNVLDELKIAEDTILLFTSDHGDMLGSQGKTFKYKPWEESIVVPGILRYPKKIKPGQRSDLLFSHVDFMPTFLSMCGVKVPDKVQGRDLSKQLTGQGGPEPEAAFLQIYKPHRKNDMPAAWRAVRTKRYTYARFEDKPWVLYDLKADPYQLNNLIDHPAHADLRARLDKMVRQEMARTGDSWGVNMREHRIFHNSPPRYHPDGPDIQ